MAWEKCYPSNRNAPLAVAGYALLAAGVVIVFVCVPQWAWVALLGVGLIAIGWFVLRLSNAWR